MTVHRTNIRAVLREVERTKRTGLRAASQAMRPLIEESLKVFARNEFAAQNLKVQIPELIAPILQNTTLVSFFLAYNREFRDSGIKRFAFEDVIFNLEQQQGAVFRQTIELMGVEAFTFMQEISSKAISIIDAEIALSIEEGEHVAEGVKRLSKAFNKAGVAPKSLHQLEAIFRTRTQVAYNAGKWTADQDPAIQEILWGYEYVTVGDDRVRDEHAALDGLKAVKNDPIWSVIFPPNGWNCRCQTISIFDEDNEKKPSNETIEQGADEGFGFNPGQLLNVQSI